MIAAPCAANEQERLAALRRYGILDTGAEADFDAITTLLSTICDTPIALISLVDKERQWFKSRVGLDAAETHRDLAFCAHAILQRDVMMVPDATLDQRFADNPLVLEDPKIRFYAGAPLITPDNQAIGTLCAIDMRPRTLNPNQMLALQTLSTHVVNLLELRLKLEETRQLHQALEKVTAERNQLFANINHEMRTPLNAIVGFTKRLQKRIVKDTVPDYVTDGLGMIANAAESLGTLVDDVLDLSKINAGKMQLQLEDFDPVQLVHHVLDTLSIRAEERGVTLHPMQQGRLPMLRGDARKITQILLNLLSNAVKFTPSGKQVHVFCEYQNGQLVLTVQDEGMGIPQEDLKRIFLPFVQSSNQQHSDIKGTGLGLSIVKAFVDLMHGGIHVSSKVDVGTTFNIMLPLPTA
jgi:signal transduction histidine kinase